MSRQLDLQCRVSGRFTLKVSGRVVADFPNLITNAGLDALAVGSVGAAAVLGTDTNAPLASDTGLNGEVGGSTVQGGTSNTSITPAFRSVSRVYLFEVGVVPAGNYSSVGIRGGAGGVLYSKARILDAQGNPTTVAITATDFVEVVYEMRESITTSDLNFTGLNVGGTLYNGFRRPVNALSSPDALPLIGAFGTSGDLTFLRAYSGTLRPWNDAAPTGQLGTSSAGVFVAYSAGSFQREATFTFGRLTANGNIKSIVLRRGSTQGGPYMHDVGWEFANAIPKANTQALSFTVRWTWDRA